MTDLPFRPSRRQTVAGLCAAGLLLPAAPACSRPAPDPQRPGEDDDAWLARLLSGATPRIPARGAPYCITRPLRLQAGTTVAIEPGTRIRWEGRHGALDDLVGVFEAAGDGTGVVVEGGGEAQVECATPSPFVYAAMMRGWRGFTVTGLLAVECQHVQVGTPVPDYRIVRMDGPGVNIARDVHIVRGGARFATLQQQGFGGCALSFCDGAHLEDAVYENCCQGVQWWGGNANPGGGKGEGMPPNQRKCRNVLIERVSVRNITNGGIWGAMGHGVVVRDCVADTCGDVGFDTEGCTDVVFERCTSRNARNGCFSTFFLCNGVRFVDCHGVVDHKEAPLLRVYNDSQSNALNRGLEVTGGIFECRDPTGPGTFDTASGPVQTIAVTGATFHNVRIDLAHSNMHRTSVSGNTLDFTVPLDAPAIRVGASKVLEGVQPARPGAASVTNNRIRLRAPSPGRAATAIAIWEDDFNGAASDKVSGNTISGPFTTGVIVTNATGNAGIVPSFAITGNRFAGLAPGARLLRVTAQGPAAHRPVVRWDDAQTRDGRAVPLAAALGG